MASGLFSYSNSKKSSVPFINGSVEDQLGELRQDIASLAKLMSKRGSIVSKDVRAKAYDARDSAEAGLSDLMDTGEQLLSELRDRYATTEKQVRHTVREHPLATLGAAAAVGVFVALLLRR